MKQSKYMKLQRMLHKAGLTFQQFVTIESCVEMRRMKDIAGDLEISTAAITGLVDRLDAKGMVFRRRGTKEEDRRTVYVQTSKQGAEIVAAAHKLFE